MHIKDLKMSRSLKNFITVRDVLGTYNARQLRFLFLMNHWNRLMNYDPDTSFAEAKRKEE